MAKTPTSRKNTSISKIEIELKKLKQEASVQGMNARNLANQANKEEVEGQTRHQLAKLITWLYFGMLATLVLGIPLYNLLAFVVTDSHDYRLNLLDTLQGYQALVGTLVGFVVAYYFKDKPS